MKPWAALTTATVLLLSALCGPAHAQDSMLLLGENAEAEETVPSPTAEETAGAARGMLALMIAGLVVTYVGLQLLSKRRRAGRGASAPDEETPIREAVETPFERAQRYLEQRERGEAPDLPPTGDDNGQMH